MKSVQLFLLSACAIFLLASPVTAQKWLEVVPLQSTCEDVKRIFGVKNCDYVIQTDEGPVSLSYATKPCVDGWNVPPGTVLSVSIYPKAKPNLDELSLDMKLFEVVVPLHQSDWRVYLNAAEGLAITVDPSGRVNNMTRGPKAKDAYLHRPNSLSDIPVEANYILGALIMEQYGSVSAREERRFLDRFAQSVKDNPDMTAYIVSYGGKRSYMMEARDRADRAKSYLIKKWGIEAARVKTMDGGYREEAATDLYIVPKGASAPIPLPTVCLEEVIIRSPKEK